MNETDKKNTLNILLVEDNPGHAELIKRGMASHPLKNNIFHVENGELALDYLYHRGVYQDYDDYKAPNLILLDLRLPKIDGLDILREIKSSQELMKIPTVILSTSDAEQDVSQAYEYHANSYLVKPLNFSRFSQMMKDLGYYWLDWNRSPWISHKMVF